MVGAGGMAAAAQEMARVQRELDGYMRERAAWRAGRISENRTEAKPESHTESLCYYLCSDCGYLADTSDFACPACGYDNWFDLGSHDIADLLRDREEKQRNKAPAWTQLSLLLVVLGVFGSVVMLIPPSPWLIGLLALSAFFVIYLGNRPWTVYLLSKVKQTRPYRWRMPMPQPMSNATVEQKISGIASQTGSAYRAPFSGRNCLAYRICVLFDTPKDARPPQWVLQEDVCADFRIGEKLIRGDRVTIKRRLKQIPARQFKAAGLDLQLFLRERGLFLYEGEYSLFEAIVDPSDEVTISSFKGMETVILS